MNVNPILLTSNPVLKHFKLPAFTLPPVISVYRVDAQTGERIQGMARRDQESILVRAGYYIVYHDREGMKSTIEVDNILRMMELYICIQERLHPGIESHVVEKRLVEEILARRPGIRLKSLWDIVVYTHSGVLFTCLKEMIEGYTDQTDILNALSRIYYHTAPVAHAPLKRTHGGPISSPTHSMYPPYQPYTPPPFAEVEPVTYDVDEVIKVEMLAGRVTKLFTKDGDVITMKGVAVSNDGKLLPDDPDSTIGRRTKVIKLLYKVIFGEVERTGKITAVNEYLGKNLMKLPLNELVEVVTLVMIENNSAILTDEERTQLKDLVSKLIKRVKEDNK